MLEHVSMGVLVVLLIVQQILHHMERKDLYNRIMAKDLPEYKSSKPGIVRNQIRKSMRERNIL